MARRAIPWSQITSSYARDYTNGPTISQSTLRLFGAPDTTKPEVTLFRDNHAWCPYCQKIWMFLEEKKIPYQIRKVTMFCYGKKESWYTDIVPRGMLPALELKGKIITESDDILMELEKCYGPLGPHLRQVQEHRILERNLFRAWCQWLCYPARSPKEEGKGRLMFEQPLTEVDKALGMTPGPYFLEEFSIVDCIFIPYLERMVASLYYYKAYDIKANAPNVARWFAALETRETYRGTQSDLMTHVHDLPPQMGGCYHSDTPEQQALRQQIDAAPWGKLPDCSYAEPEDAVDEVLFKVCRHKDSVIAANPVQDKQVVDESLRAALTYMQTGQVCQAPPGGDVALRYIRDRVSCPRDLSIWAARRFREACERTAAAIGPGEAPPITLDHRRDADPLKFVRKQVSA